MHVHVHVFVGIRPNDLISNPQPNNSKGVLFKAILPFFFSFQVNGGWRSVTTVHICKKKIVLRFLYSTSWYIRTAVLIIIEGQFQIFERFTSSKPVLETV